MTENVSMPTRRAFHRALLTLAPLAAAGPALAQEPKANSKNGVADILLALARAKYGQHLTAEQLEQVKQSLQRDLLGIELLRQVPLRNGDEPSFVFRADLP
jgi:hypothetical protein